MSAADVAFSGGSEALRRHPSRTRADAQLGAVARIPDVR
jgi:hypothetical protein